MVPPTGRLQTYRELLPAPELAGHLSCVWVQEAPAGAPPYLHRTIPNGTVELFCRIGDAPEVTGPRTGPAVKRLEPGSVVPAEKRRLRTPLRPTRTSPSRPRSRSRRQPA